MSPVQQDSSSFHELTGKQGDAEKTAAAARQMLNVNLLDRAQAIAEQALAENENSADLHSLIANILDRRGEWQASLIHVVLSVDEKSQIQALDRTQPAAAPRPSRSLAATWLEALP